MTVKRQVKNFTCRYLNATQTLNSCQQCCLRFPWDIPRRQLQLQWKWQNGCY